MIVRHFQIGVQSESEKRLLFFGVNTPNQNNNAPEKSDGNKAENKNKVSDSKQMHEAMGGKIVDAQAKVDELQKKIDALNDLKKAIVTHDKGNGSVTAPRPDGWLAPEEQKNLTDEQKETAKDVLKPNDSLHTYYVDEKIKELTREDDAATSNKDETGALVKAKQELREAKKEVRAQEGGKEKITMANIRIAMNRGDWIGAFKAGMKLLAQLTGKFDGTEVEDEDLKPLKGRMDTVNKASKNYLFKVELSADEQVTIQSKSGADFSADTKGKLTAIGAKVDGKTATMDSTDLAEAEANMTKVEKLSKENEQTVSASGQKALDGAAGDWIIDADNPTKELTRMADGTLVTQNLDGTGTSTFDMATKTWTEKSGQYFNGKEFKPRPTDSSQKYDAGKHDFVEKTEDEKKQDAEQKEKAKTNEKNAERKRNGAAYLESVGIKAPNFEFSGAGTTQYYFKFDEGEGQWKWQFEDDTRMNPLTKVPVDYEDGSSEINNDTEVGFPKKYSSGVDLWMNDLNDDDILKVAGIIRDLKNKTI